MVAPVSGVTLKMRHSNPVPIGVLSPENSATNDKVPGNGACAGAGGATEEGVVAPGGAAMVALQAALALAAGIASAKSRLRVV